ncbi:hypothetical protein NKG94_30980 [Micromonospora sp. M12]
MIDTATNTVIATVPVGFIPRGWRSPDGSRAYVTSQGPNTVSVIDTATNTVTATVPVGDSPIGVAITRTAAALRHQPERRHRVGDRHRHQHRDRHRPRRRLPERVAITLTAAAPTWPTTRTTLCR